MAFHDRVEFYGYISRWVYVQMENLELRAYKTQRRGVYQLPVADRCAIAVVLRIAPHRLWSENAMLLRKYTSIPYWMSRSAYYEMLSELGVEL